MKISKLSFLTIFIVALLFTTGCATKKSYKELSEESRQEEDALREERIKNEVSEEEYIEREPAIRNEKLLEEKVTDLDRSYPAIMRDDPMLKELASQQGRLYTVYFDYDSYSIISDFLTKLKKNAHWINANPRVTILIEGHADARGGNEYNLALGQRRAQGIEKFLTDYGVRRSKLSTISYGEEKPIDKSETEDAWRKNRRVEFTIVR